MVSEKKKKTQSQKHYPGPSKAQPWFPDALLFQLGLIKAPYVSNPSASGVIQMPQSIRQLAKLPKHESTVEKCTP